MHHTLPLERITGSDRRQLQSTQQFRAFNEQLFRTLETALSEQTDDSVAPEQLQEGLLQLLQSQLKKLPPGSSTDAQLVMVGLADELFLSNDWYGWEWWNANTLEFSLFGTRAAGDSLYEIADRIISESSQKNVGLAAILLDALALGFKGKYSDEADSKLIVYRTALREAVMLGRVSEDHSRKTFCPDAYDRAFIPDKGRSLPSIRRWMVGAGIIGVILLVISHLVWWSATDSLRDILKQLTV